MGPKPGRQEVLNIRQKNREGRPCPNFGFVAQQKVLNGEETRSFRATLLVPTFKIIKKVLYLPPCTCQ
jgi:hypothetical protein